MTRENTIAIFAASNARRLYLAQVASFAGFKEAALPIQEGGLEPDFYLVEEAMEVPDIPQAQRIVIATSQYPMRASHLIDILWRAHALKNQPAFLTIGTYQLDTRHCLWRRDGGEDSVRLTEKETHLLAFLKEKGGQASREELLEHIWGYAQGVETHTIETHIYRLRQKIEENPSLPKILLTQEDGYKLNA